VISPVALIPNPTLNSRCKPHWLGRYRYWI